MNTTIEEIFQKVINDSTFIESTKTRIDKILKDSKIDYSDIPELILILNDSLDFINKNSKLNTEDLELILRKICIHFIGESPDTEESINSKLLDSCIKLLLIKPKLKESVNCCQFFTKKEYS